MPLRCARLFLAVCITCSYADAQTVKLIRFAAGQPFHMGKVTSMRIVSPDAGAQQLTLNYSTSGTDSEFSQHVHDHSDDTIMVLQGQADLRQGPNRTPMKAGTCAFVPAGQIHGTITTAPGTVMISTQVPPDLVLYTGARDSSKPGAAPPKGIITAGAVRFVSFENRNGYFVQSSMGAKRVAVARRVLSKGQALRAGVGPGQEQLLFVWKGKIAAKSAGAVYEAGEKDTIFASGPVELVASGDSAEPAVVFQIQAPPHVSHSDAGAKGTQSTR